ncbi:MAG: hypothetical protein ACYDDE_00425 [bacterium]
MNYKIIPAPKKIADWNKNIVITKRELSNGWGSIPAKTIMSHYGNNRKSSLYALYPCSCCGLRAFITIKDSMEERLKDFDFIEIEE